MLGLDLLFLDGEERESKGVIKGYYPLGSNSFIHERLFRGACCTPVLVAEAGGKFGGGEGGERENKITCCVSVSVYPDEVLARAQKAREDKAWTIASRMFFFGLGLLIYLC